MKAKLIVGLSVAAVLSAPTVAYGVSVTSQPTERTSAAQFKKMEGLRTTGVTWAGGYRFLPPGQKTRGAFHFKGTLRSTDKNHGAKLEVRVEGYAKKTYRASRGTSKRYDEIAYDGAAQRTKDAWAMVCRDRGSFRPDNCSDEKYYGR